MRLKQILLGAILLLSAGAFAQEKTGVHFISSFIFRDEVFNYEYKLTPNQVSSLKFDKVSGNVQVEPEKIKAQMDDIKKKLKEKYIDWMIDPENYNGMDAGLTKISSDLTDGISKLLSSNKEIDNITKSLSSVTASLHNDTVKVTEIQGIINSLDLLKNTNVAILATGEEVRFADLSPDRIRSILHNKIGLFLKVVSPPDETDLVDLSQKLFYEIMARRSFNNDQPSTAFLKLVSEDITGYFEDVQKSSVNITGYFEDVQKSSVKQAGKESLNSNLGKKPKEGIEVPVSLKFKTASIEFEAGTMKNIEAYFTIKVNGQEKEIKFRNNIPISITNKFTPERLREHRVFASTPDGINFWSIIAKNAPAGITVDSTSKKPELYFRLSDLIRYDIILSNYREDYSPEDAVIELSLQQNVIELKKQRRAKILTVRTYTDFNGINNDQPNGLIQVEASLGVNVLTRRFQRSLFLFRSKSSYIGVLTRADLTGHLSKIEQNNRYLLLTQNDTVALPKTSLKQFNIIPLNLYKYKNTGVDVNLNLYKINFANVMTNLQLNGSVGIFRSGVADSLIVKNNGWTKINDRHERMVTSTHLSLNLTYEFTPEERYGFRLSATNMWMGAQSPEILLDKIYKIQIRTLAADGFINLNEKSTSRLFFRWKFNWQGGEIKENYNQVQLGYLVDVFKQN